MKSMAWYNTDSTHRMAITVHAETNPSDEEWGEYLDGIRSIGSLTGYRAIVYSRGGGPNGTQRRRLIDLLATRRNPTVILTSSTVTRGIATAISWFNPNLRGFGLDQRAAAFQYLKLSPADERFANSTIERLLSELSIALSVG